MAVFNVTGKVRMVTPPENIPTESGYLTKRFLIIMTDEARPKVMAFVAFQPISDYLDQLKPGDNVKVVFTIESREYNQKWYTDLRLRDVRIIREESIMGPTEAVTAGTPTENIDVSKVSETVEETEGVKDDDINDIFNNGTFDENESENSLDDDTGSLFEDKENNDEDESELPF